MIKLEEYKLTGYKNILDADLSFQNVNVIIGANNSGKSNFIQSISFLNFLINTASTDDLENYFKNGFHKTYFRELMPTTNDLEKFPFKHKISFSLKFSNSITNRIFNYFLELEVSEDLFETSYIIKKESLDTKESNKPGQAISVFKRDGNKVKYGSKLTKTGLFEGLPSHFSVIRILKLVLNTDTKSYTDAVNSLNSIIKTPIFYFSNLELLKTENSDRLDFHNGRVVSFELEEEIIVSLGSMAAIALTNRQLIDDMEELFQSLTRLIARAIDEKSPYTGGHCNRVPELTMMMAEAVCAHNKGPLADFVMDDKDKYELSVAGWLHDCGKVTTPEYVVDKATKLETIFDRIDLVDCRIELAKAEVKNQYQEKIIRALKAGQTPDSLEIELQENPRSRSAKLRLAIRTENDPFDREEDLLPRVPQLSDYRWAA